MRTIKFRAWDKKEKKWYKPLNPYDSSLGNWMMTNDGRTYVKGKYQELELMQYTGLKDKNGNEAYFDDIISDGHNPPFVIEFNYPMLARLSEIEFEVIGTIYENEELLK